MSKPISRRQFLGTSGRTAAGVAAGVAAATASRTVARGPAASANEKIVVGLIGCGGMGTHKLKNFMTSPLVEVAALCDPDSRQPIKNGTFANVEEKFGRKPAFYTDYQKICDRGDVDAVIVATPDHWHAIAMIRACQAGKDVYVEKPCCHTIEEGKRMVAAARKYDRMVQVGMHQRSAPHFKEAVEFVRKGGLNGVAYTRTWQLRNHTPDGIGNPPDGAPPAEVDYDRWLGPAPKRPFNPNRFHYTWRWFYDYGCTLVGDWNVHLQDIVHWAMDTYAPLSVSSTGGKYLLKDNRETPDTMEATYEFETPSGQKFCQMFSYTFCCNTPMNGKPYGIQFFGSNGSVLVDREGWETFPDTRGVPDPDNPGKKIRVPRMEKITKPGEDSHIAHAINFLDALKSRKKEDLKCDIEIGYKTAAACHLANMSYKLGRKLFWDGDRGICIRQDGKPDAEANVLLTKEYRAPYTLPKV